jgi:hypothetical protein
VIRTGNIQVFLATMPVDMRKSFDGLAVTGRLKTSHFEALQNQPVVCDVIHSGDDSLQAVVV